MKKQSFILIIAIVVIISTLSELVFPMIKEEQWTNYTHSWDTKLKKKPKRVLAGNVGENKITFCISDRQLTK